MIEDLELREELLSVEPNALDKKDNLSYLAAFLVLGGELSIGRNPKVSLSFRHTDVAFFAVELLAALYGYRPELGLDGSFAKKRSRQVRFELPLAIGKQLLTDCRMLKVEDGKEVYTLGFGSMRWVKDNRYLAALTMECGRLYGGEDYRLDLALSIGGRRQAELTAILAKHDVRYSLSETEEKCRVMVRRDAVSTYLALIGAMRCSLAVTEYYLERNVNCTLNRNINCELNNMDKAYQAATKQLWAIRVLKEKGEYAHLPYEVRQVGDVREQHDRISLQEIADMLSINKTAVYRRMKVITDAAEKYKGE